MTNAIKPVMCDSVHLAWRQLPKGDHARTENKTTLAVDPCTTRDSRSFQAPSTLIHMHLWNRHVIFLLLCVGFLAMAGCSSRPESSANRTPESVSLRVATWNIKHGLGMDGHIDLERTATVIEAFDADIVALQEVDEDVRRSGKVDQATWLGDRLGMHASFGSFMDYQGGRYGLALLSRLPIESSQSWRLTDGNEPRVALAIEVRPSSGDPIAVVCVHFDWVEDDGYRFTQATETMDRLGKLDIPWIVLGDFNDTPESRTMRGFHAIGRNAGKPRNARATFPADDPEIEIDFIVTGPNGRWKVDDVEVLEESIASDHRPVIAVLEPVGD